MGCKPADYNRAMRWITRCPECKTVYQVGPDQLEVSRGWLRCGHCQHAFDSTGLLLEWASAAATDTEERVDIKSFLRLQDADAAPSLQVATQTSTGLGHDPVWGAAADVAEDIRALPSSHLDDVRAVSEPPSAKPWPTRVVLLMCMGVLVLQLLWFWRDVLGARWPALVPVLTMLCRPVHCRIEAPRLPESMVLESSHLLRRPTLADETPAYGLQVSVRNASALTLAMVSLELTLTDPQDKPVLRRVLDPSDLGAPAQLAGGQIWEAQLDFGLDLPDTVSAYRLVVFYP